MLPAHVALCTVTLHHLPERSATTTHCCRNISCHLIPERVRRLHRCTDHLRLRHDRNDLSGWKKECRWYLRCWSCLPSNHRGSSSKGEEGLVHHHSCTREECCCILLDATELGSLLQLGVALHQATKGCCRVGKVIGALPCCQVHLGQHVGPREGDHRSRRTCSHCMPLRIEDDGSVLEGHHIL